MFKGFGLANEFLLNDNDLASFPSPPVFLERNVEVRN